jgi:hypothetical protein
MTAAGSGEDDGLVTDEEDAILGPVADGAGEDQAFGVLAELDDLVGGVAIF